MAYTFRIFVWYHHSYLRSRGSLLVIAAWQVYDKCLPCVTEKTLSDSVLLLQIEADVCLFVLTQTLDGKAWSIQLR